MPELGAESLAAQVAFQPLVKILQQRMFAVRDIQYRGGFTLSVLKQNIGQSQGPALHRPNQLLPAFGQRATGLDVGIPQIAGDGWS